LGDNLKRSEPTLPTFPDGFHQRSAEGGAEAREGNRPTIFRPQFTVHLDPKLAVAVEQHPRKLDFAILVLLQVFDGNLQARFRKRLVSRGL